MGVYVSLRDLYSSIVGLNKPHFVDIRRVSLTISCEGFPAYSTFDKKINQAFLSMIYLWWFCTNNLGSYRWR